MLVKGATVRRITVTIVGRNHWGQWVSITKGQEWVSMSLTLYALRWRHNERDGVSNHQPHDCLLKCLFRCRSKKTSKLRVTGLCAGNSPVTGEFPAQKTSNVKNVAIWWRHHGATVAVILFETTLWHTEIRQAANVIIIGCILFADEY